MRGELEPDFEFETSGPNMGLKMGPCGHCRLVVRFDQLEEGSSFSFATRDTNDGGEYDHAFLLGRCTHPGCRLRDPLKPRPIGCPPVEVRI